jgi:hypothetical protein
VSYEIIVSSGELAMGLQFQVMKREMPSEEYLKDYK